MRYNERLANDVGPLEVRKTSNKFAFRDKVLRQSDLVFKGAY
jgi:hypothetical protein